MIRAVLDTNTLVSAIINTKGSVAQEIYQNFKHKRFSLVISPEILEEVEEVSNRERIIKRHQLSTKELKIIISELASLSYLVPGTTKVEVVRDPDDNKIISAAVEGQATYIVTRDEDLLDLKEYQEISEALLRIKIISPETFMGILRTQ
ncbi:putative toxin-antitoxin system toxin component, PIN family [Candidatus Microgenomates bacterium]|nr:putative toxin-antitoxin system toxin component, PIN family [Candidatus Microgenomates bacterium]